MDKIILKVYENIYERADGKGLESYQTVKYNDKWIVGKERSKKNNTPIALHFKGNWDNIKTLIETLTNKSVEIQYTKW